MSSFYRSEEMRFCQIIVEKDAAFSCVAELGKKSYVQFKDLNSNVSNFQRMFVKVIRRFDEMERKLRFLENEIKKDCITINDNTYEEENDVISHHEIAQLEQTLIDLERDVIHMNECDYQLKKNYLELKEWEAVLEKTNQFFQGGINDAAMQEIEQAEETENGIQLRTDKEPISYTVGVIAHEKVNAFERILWRACRRTAFLRYSKIEEKLENPDTREEMEKSVFIIFYNGHRLRHIIDKVSEGYKAKQYSNNLKTSHERQAAIIQVRSNITDLNTVIKQTKEHRYKVLNAAAINLKAWLKQIQLHKSVYHTLNYFTFDAIGKFFVAECWVPLHDVENVKKALENGVGKNGGTVKPVLNILHTDETPPTYNKTNKFTRVFQNIVDSYGIATYLELNPAPYYIITFPFLFSCMFGDLGHGFLLFIIGLYLVLREKNIEARQIENDIFEMFFSGRYVILLAGIFSMHAGFMYNDSFSKSFNIFGSSWQIPIDKVTLMDSITKDIVSNRTTSFTLNPLDAFKKSSGPYLYGIDPVWSLASNKLIFLNSMKMKMSILLGVSQMIFGICLSLKNYRFFKSTVEIYTMFIPQMIFMICLFFYLCIQIVVKWIFFYVKEEYIFGKLYPGSNCAPSLLSGFIDIFMWNEHETTFVNMSRIISQKNNHTEYEKIPNCHLSQWYPGKAMVEHCMLLLALFCIPIMIFGKPIHVLLEQRKAKKALSDNMSVRINMHTNETEIQNELQNKNKVDQNENDDMHNCNATQNDKAFGDVLISQTIHTIEYILGCVSHTASYLRLWALSLAHSQLSDVVWEMVFKKSLHLLEGYWNAIPIYLSFFMFTMLTISIFVFMEGLSAFLHALRLHWVEFQSKFYGGVGYPFIAFSFKEVLQKANEVELNKK